MIWFDPKPAMRPTSKLHWKRGDQSEFMWLLVGHVSSLEPFGSVPIKVLGGWVVPCGSGELQSIQQILGSCGSLARETSAACRKKGWYVAKPNTDHGCFGMNAPLNGIINDAVLQDF
eukprot:3349195-Amphidinium_carterae.1